MASNMNVQSLRIMKAPSKMSALVRNHSKSSLAYSKVLDEKSSSSSFSGCTKLMTDNMFIGLNSIKHLEGLSERCVTPKFFSKCSHCVIRNPCWTQDPDNVPLFG